MASKFVSGIDSFEVKRLKDVTGLDSRTNDIIFSSSAERIEEAEQHVIFFGGDVQNYPEVMSSGMHVEYYEFNLENTAKLLAKRFKNSLVFVIKPSTMMMNTFSVYKNFLSFSDDGIPYIGAPPRRGKGDEKVDVKAQNDVETKEEVPGVTTVVENNADNETNSQEGLTHLVNLIHTALQKISPTQSFTSSANIILVGFSKGCVVLNQLMFEIFKQKTILDDVGHFIEHLKSVYWLDGGHVGDRDAWITSDEILSGMVKNKLALYAHVSPYQIRDSLRKWIGKEEAKFVYKLRKMNGNITEVEHFFDEPGSIINHFRILTKF